MVIISVFQTDDAGSIPATRSRIRLSVKRAMFIKEMLLTARERVVIVVPFDRCDEIMFLAVNIPQHLVQVYWIFVRCLFFK